MQFRVRFAELALQDIAVVAALQERIQTEPSSVGGYELGKQMTCERDKVCLTIISSAPAWRNWQTR
jgi:hypothetical protein